MVNIDTIGTFSATKAVYEIGMKGRPGVIINNTARISDGLYMQTHSGSAKAAVESMTKHLAEELGLQNIRVAAIAPGPIEGTEGADRLSGNKYHCVVYRLDSYAALWIKDRHKHCCRISGI